MLEAGLVVLAWLQSKASAFHNLGELGKLPKERQPISKGGKQRRS